MPRGPRIDFPGAFHHIYARGIEKRVIFKDDRDREELRRRMFLNLRRFQATCLAWSYLPNHFHLLFQSDSGVLSRFMHCLLAGYSLYFNRRHGRAGHLFQNRFRSVLIDSEPYLLELIRYIHLNPLRAGLVGTLEELCAYRWSGHHGIVRSGNHPWDGIPYLSEYFRGEGREETVSNYQKFLEDGLRQDPEVAISDHPGPDDDTVFEKWEDPRIAREQVDSLREFLRTVDRICRNSGITREHLRGRRDRTVSQARRDILGACVMEMGMSRRIVCSWLGITDAGGAYLLRPKVPRGGIPHETNSEDR